MRFENMEKFCNMMREAQIAVYSFRYRYNEVSCFVAVCLLTDDDRRKEAKAIVRLRFMKPYNLDEFVDCYASKGRLLSGVGEVRAFFCIPFDPAGFKPWLFKFYDDLALHFPKRVETQDAELDNASIITVCAHEGRDPNRIYRLSIKRNPLKKNGEPGQRTEYNSQLAQKRFPKLWEIYRTDKSVSFVFTDKKDEERTEEDIQRSFVLNDSLRKRPPHKKRQTLIPF